MSSGLAVRPGVPPSAPATVTRGPLPAGPAASGGPRRPREQELEHRALSVLAANWRGVSTVPSGAQYPHQWSWDSALISIGLARWSQRRAELELQSLFGGQWRDGRVPAVVFDPGVPFEAYFPAADFWQSAQRAGRAGGGRAPRVATTGTVQPPVHARAAWEVYRRAADEPRARAWLARLYPRLVAQHDYLRRWRTLPGSGLAVIVHPWESGLDNSPAWDEPLAAVPADLGLLTAYRRRDRAHVGADQRPTDVDYARFLRLALAYRDGGYDDAALLDRHEFLVADPLFNAAYAWSEAALGEIALRLGRDPRPHEDRTAQLGAALVTELYDAPAGCFLARDLRTGRRSATRTVGGLVPLVVPGLPASVVEAVCGVVASPSFLLPGAADPTGPAGPTGPTGPAAGFPVPSTDRMSAAFDARRYWRGPTWVNTNWLVWRGLLQQSHGHLAEQLRERTLSMVERAGCWEYFDALTGEGYGSPDFSWTAALTLDLLAGPDVPPGSVRLATPCHTRP